MRWALSACARPPWPIAITSSPTVTVADEPRASAGTPIRPKGCTSPKPVTASYASGCPATTVPLFAASQIDSASVIK